MRRYIILLSVFLFGGLMPNMLHAANSGQDGLYARAAQAYGKLPLAFVENKGQLDEQVRYVIRGARASVFFRNDGVTLDLRDAPAEREDAKFRGRGQTPLERLGVPQLPNSRKPYFPGISAILRYDPEPSPGEHAVLKLTFVGANPNCSAAGIDELPGKVNYLTGKDSSKWRTDLPAFKGVIYKDLWSGCDVIYRGDRRQLKYDIRCKPGRRLKEHPPEIRGR